MTLTAPKKSKNFDPVPAGNHVARLYEIIHIGTIPTTWQGQEKMTDRLGVCVIRSRAVAFIFVLFSSGVLESVLGLRPKNASVIDVMLSTELFGHSHLTSISLSI
jgi:hypothetical protein